MRVVGLTGSVGMGKSTTASMLRRLGLPVYDADAAVHALLAPGGAAVAPVLAGFPDVADEHGGIDRKRLGQAVFGIPAALAQLEAILHPMVRSREKRFRDAARRRRVPLLVLDVPLLFETGGDRRCDSVIVVTAPLFLQRQRMAARGVRESRLRDILRRQMPDAEKRRRADIVIRTGIGRRPALRQLIAALPALRRGLDRGRRRGHSSTHPRIPPGGRT